MKKQKLYNIGKWIAVSFLAASNYFSYLATGKIFSLVLSLLLVVLALVDLILTLKKKGMAIGAYIYITLFFILGVLSLFMGIQSFFYLQMKSLAMCVLMFAGDIGVILYSIKKLSKTRNED